MENLVNKTINLSLKGEDGDRYYLIGAFVAQAKRERWSFEEITTVTSEAHLGDYAHCLRVLSAHCKTEPHEEKNLST